jgi:transcription elongation factor Elf1
MTNIEPCPFCHYTKCKITTKRRGKYRREGDNHQVLCGKCKARGPMVQESEQNAIDAWNAWVKHAQAEYIGKGRYFCDGPAGHFYCDSLELGRGILKRIDPEGDDWTITDLRNPT